MYDIEHTVTLYDLVRYGDWTLMVLLLCATVCVFSLGCIVGHGIESARERRDMQRYAKHLDRKK